LEHAVRLEDRVRVDREARDDLLHRRQLVARREDPELDGVPHLLHELEIGRDSGTRVEMELDQRHISSFIDKSRYPVKPRGGDRLVPEPPLEIEPDEDQESPGDLERMKRLGEQDEREEDAEERL